MYGENQCRELPLGVRAKPIADEVLCVAIKPFKKLLNMMTGQEILRLRDDVAANIPHVIHPYRRCFCLTNTQGQWVNIQANAAPPFK